MLKRSKEQTGGCGTLSLRVLGDPLPETLKYEYQQSTSVPAKQSTKWKNTNQETKGSTFMIDGLQPTATGGSLYVRVRLPTAKGWSNWTTTTFRISKKEFRKWEGSASEDDVEDGVQVDAEDDEEEEPLSKRQKSKEAAELTPELTPAPELAPEPAPEPAAVAIAAPTADTDAVPQPMDVSQLTDEQKQAILDLVKAKVKTVKEDCRQTLTNTDCDVGYGYTVTFRPKAAQQARDLFRWKGKAPLEGPRPSGTSEATLEAELQRVLGLARLASDSADSKRKAEQQTEQSLGPTSSSSVGATSAATTASASATTSAVAMQIDASQAYRSRPACGRNTASCTTVRPTQGQAQATTSRAVKRRTDPLCADARHAAAALRVAADAAAVEPAGERVGARAADGQAQEAGSDREHAAPPLATSRVNDRSHEGARGAVPHRAARPRDQNAPPGKRLPV